VDQGMNSGAGGGIELRPRGVGEILSAAFELYTKNWQALMQIVAIVAIPVSLIGYLITDQVIRKSVTVTTTTIAGTTVRVASVNGGFWRASLASALVAFLGVLIAQVLTGAITRGAAGAFVGQPLAVGDAYSFGLARLWSILWVSVLVGVIVGVGFLLFVIPGFIFLTWLSVSLPSLVIEDQRGTTALGRSWNLVRGRAWPVFAVIVVAGLITGLVNAIITAPFGHNWFVRGLLAGIAWTVTTPYTALVGVLLYLDLRTRKENLDRPRLQSDLAASAP
jgi:hypothetical protein